MAALALAATLSLLPGQTAAQTLRGDFDMNGQVNISDVTSMINYLLTDSPGEPKPSDYDTLTVNGVPFVMVRVEGGVFTRTRFNGIQIETFSIGQTEVTQEMWNAVMGEQDDPPYTNKGKPKRPVNKASRDDCMAFIARLNELTGLNFRLPTMNEWLYAATGGRFTRSYPYAGSTDINEVAWWEDDNGYVQNVGLKAPNELFLFDMSGNVAEWCDEYHGNDEYGYNGNLRGGYALSSMEECLVDRAVISRPVDVRNVYNGFRIVMSTNE